MEGVSICVTAYKSVKYLKECLDSIFEQTYFKKFDNYEVLLGIDGCVETFEYVKTIISKYSHLRVYMMSSNQGTYITSNTIMSMASYDTLLRFDSDDIMRPNMVEYIMNHKSDSTIYRFKYENFNRETGETKKSPRPADGIIAISKKEFLEYGGYRPWKCGADSELLSRLRSVVKISSTESILFDRRIHSDSLTNNGETQVFGRVSPLRRRYMNFTSNERRLTITEKDAKITMVTNDYYAVHPNTKIKKLNESLTLIDRLEGDSYKYVAPVKKKIKLYGVTLVYNESKMIPYIMPYYERMGFDKLIIYDNESTDNTVKLLEKYPFVEIRSFSTGGKKNNRIQSEIKSNAYKEFCNEENAWMYISDFDEVLYYDGDFKEYLKEKDKEGYNYLNQQIFELLSDKFPDLSDKKLTHEHVEHGNLWDAGFGCKLTLFKVSGVKAMTYSPGAHRCSLTVPYTPKPLNWADIRSLHVKYIDYDYCNERTKMAAGHRSEEDQRKGYGVQYEKCKNDAAFKKMWNDRVAKQILTSDYMSLNVRKGGITPIFTTYVPKKSVNDAKSSASTQSVNTKLPEPAGPVAPITKLPSSVCQFIINCGATNKSEQEYIKCNDVIEINCSQSEMSKAYAKLADTINSGKYKWILVHQNNIHPVHVQSFANRLNAIVVADSNIGIYSPAVINYNPSNLNARKSLSTIRSVHEVSGYCLLINAEAFYGKLNPDFTGCITGSGFIRHICSLAAKGRYSVVIDDSIYHTLADEKSLNVSEVQRQRFEYMKRNNVDVSDFKYPAVQVKIKFN